MGGRTIYLVKARYSHYLLGGDGQMLEGHTSTSLSLHICEFLRVWGSISVLPRPQKDVKRCHNIIDDVAILLQHYSDYDQCTF